MRCVSARVARTTTTEAALPPPPQGRRTWRRVAVAVAAVAVVHAHVHHAVHRAARSHGGARRLFQLHHRLLVIPSESVDGSAAAGAVLDG